MRSICSAGQGRVQRARLQLVCVAFLAGLFWIRGSIPRASFRKRTTVTTSRQRPPPARIPPSQPPLTNSSSFIFASSLPRTVLHHVDQAHLQGLPLPLAFPPSVDWPLTHHQEYADLSQDPPDGITVSLPPSQSLHTWHVVLAGPPSSPFHGGRFGVLLTLPSDYPFKPPAVKFVTRVYHPNVSDDSLGGVCLGLLKPENWKPSTKVAAVLGALRSLLVEPLPDDPLADRIADEYRSDRPAWEKKARQFVERYAMQDPEFPAS